MGLHGQTNKQLIELCVDLELKYGFKFTPGTLPEDDPRKDEWKNHWIQDPATAAGAAPNQFGLAPVAAYNPHQVEAWKDKCDIKVHLP
jgi:hypothetical protein